METERRSDTAAGEIHAGMGDFHVSHGRDFYKLYNL